MEKWTLLLFTVFSVVLLQSCDPGITYNQMIQNDSDFDLMFNFINPYPYAGNTHADSTLIPAHSEVSIRHRGGLGRLVDFEDCDIYADSVRVNVLNNDTLSFVIDLYNREDWIYKVIEKDGRGGICECPLMVSNSDIK